MTVQILSLCGLSAAEAGQAADALLDIDTGAERIDQLLVLDDTALLDVHEPVYVHIDNAGRVQADSMLYVLIGPRNGDGGRKLELPGNLGGERTPVLWVSRPAGIEWKVEKSAVANRHPGPMFAALDQQHPLVRLLLVPEMFGRVRQAFKQVPVGVASPGLWLAGAEDEAATFAGALAVAIRRTCDSGPAADDPYPDLAPARAGGAHLYESGPLAGYIDRIAAMDADATHALSGLGGLGGMIRRGDNGTQRSVSRVGEALADLRDLVARVLHDANAGIGEELTPSQRDLLRGAGIGFAAETAGPGAAASGVAAPGVAGAEESLLYRTVARTVRAGDPLPSVTRRLTATEREITRAGSGRYLPEVAKHCPPELLARLADPPQKLPRRGGVADARRELGLTDAMTATKALESLILDVANREWSPAGVTARQIAGTRTALDGARKALTEHASTTGGPGGLGGVGGAGSARGGARGARIARFGESYLPVLRDLVLHVVAAEMASPSATGQEALRAASGRTAGMLREWTSQVVSRGVTAQPSFATSGPGATLYVIEDDVVSVREALLYPVKDEMWQLCGPGDLGALDVTAPVGSIRFASRLTRDALIGMPGDEPVWTSSGSFAGLLRLVPLQAWAAGSHWGKTDLSTATER